MEELFTGIEFIKNRSNLGLSIAEVFEDKHGYGVAIREDGFSSNVLDCLSKVTEFVSDEIYSNISEYVRAIRVK